MLSFGSNYRKAMLPLVLFALVQMSLQAQIMDSRWTEPFQLSTPNTVAERARLVLDGQANTHAAWMERLADGGTQLRYAKFDGAFWDGPITLVARANGSKLGELQLTIDGASVLHLTWTEAITDAVYGRWPIAGAVHHLTARSWESLQASNWTSQARIDVAAFRQVMQVGADGRLHLLYSNMISGSPAVYHVSSTDSGRTWSIPVRVSVDELPGREPFLVQLEVGPDDVLHAVWESKLGWQSVAVHYVRSIDGGVTWIDHVVIDEATADLTFMQYAYPQLAVHHNLVTVVWAGGGFANVGRRFRYSNDGGRTWMPAEQLFGALHGASAGEGLAFDASGRLHFLDLLRFPQGLWSSAWIGGAWSDPSVVYQNLDGSADTIGNRFAVERTDLLATTNQLVATFTEDTPNTENLRLWTINTAKPLVVVPYLHAGNGYTATLHVSSLSPSQAYGLVRVFDRSGIPYPGTAFEGSLINQWLPLPSLSTTRIRIPDQAETALPGFATIEIDPNASVVSAILRNPAGEEVVIPPATPSRAAAVLMENSSEVTTQIVALRFTEAPIQLSLYDSTGNLMAERTWNGPGRQLVSSIADLFELRSEFMGTIHLRSVGNIATIGIRLKADSWEVVPSVPIDAARIQHRLLMPHFADGWGWSTTFTTLNSGEKLAATSGRFNDEVGNELPVKVDGVLRSAFTAVTPARGVSRVSTSGDSDPLKSGVVTLEFDTPGGVLPMFRNGAALEVISALQPKARSFALGVERSEKIETAIAIASPSRAVVRFRLLDSSGSEVASGIIQGNRIKTATVISQLASLPPAFQGILLLDSDDEFVPLSLRLGGASLAANPVVKQ